jgi:hypothetical protein
MIFKYSSNSNINSNNKICYNNRRRNKKLNKIILIYTKNLIKILSLNVINMIFINSGTKMIKLPKIMRKIRKYTKT